MNILLAGGNGFIGRYVREKFVPKADITVIDSFFDRENINSIKLDLTSKSAVAEFAFDTSHCDVLIFLVGLAHAKGKGADMPVFRSINLQTIVNLLQALEKVHKLPGKIIFASTISVYGERYYHSEYNESLEPEPYSPYAITKLEAEKYLLDNYAGRSWLLRFAPVYSENFTLNIDRRTKINKFFYKAGNGKARLSLCKIDNIMQAMADILEDNVPPGVYNISDPIEYTYTDLLSSQEARYVLRIPKSLIWLVRIGGKLTRNIGIIENSTKLITDNIFSSNKIRRFIDLPHTLNDSL
jgi:nucleoside-diphosphate-sugar epimerase